MTRKYELLDEHGKKYRNTPYISSIFIMRCIVLLSFAAIFFFMCRMVFSWSDTGLSERERAALREGPTHDTVTVKPKYRDRNVRPQHSLNLDIPGKMTCPGVVIKPSAKSPDDANQVRPADITYVAALGDSITVGHGAVNNASSKYYRETGSWSYDKEEDYDSDEMNYVGNSFDMGGDGGLETHLTLPTILRHLNPALVGFSLGRGLSEEHAALNVAYPGRLSNDFPRQATELVQRFRNYPEASVKNDWKLVNMFIGTNDISSLCRTGFGTSKQEYKNYIREAIMIIQSALPKTIVSLIGMWNLDFEWRASKIIYNKTVSCMIRDFDKIAQQRIVEYREALVELSAEPRLQTKNLAVTVQRVFDDLYTPLKKADGKYNINFYATDVFHLSKYGNSLVAKQLWKHLISPDGNKTTTNDEMTDESPALACPDKDCPFIRTPVNSVKCTLPPPPTTTTAKPSK